MNLPLDTKGRPFLEDDFREGNAGISDLSASIILWAACLRLLSEESVCISAFDSSVGHLGIILCNPFHEVHALGSVISRT